MPNEPLEPDYSLHLSPSGKISPRKLPHRFQYAKNQRLNQRFPKYSGRKLCDVPVPETLFEHEVFLTLGRSMLKRFQMNGRTLEEHEVTDRLLLTY